RAPSHNPQTTKNVVVTGIGAVTPIGTGVQGLWDGVLRAESAIRTVSSFDPSSFNSHLAAEILDFKPDAYLDPKRHKRLDRFSRFAMVAGLLALQDAGIEPGSFDPDRAGVTIGSALGGASSAEHEYVNFMTAGIRAVSPSLALSVFGGAASCNLAIEFGLTGYTTANSDSCASGPIALGNALNAIRRGEADLMLAGGVEAPLFPLTFGAFSLIRAMSTRNDDPATACRPFDKDRDGFVMAEGAALLVLETEERARSRGARIYAELAGFGLTNDAYHMVAPRPDAAQAARAIRLAMADAGVSPAEVTYVNAHGSSTLLNDSTETQAIKLALGERAYEIPVSGTKGMHGHALGATGAIEAAICALSIANAWVPPTVNLLEPGPGLDLDYVHGAGRAARHNAVVSNSFGFGGINACLVLRSLA
ncbi:MAG TPA: beta-ketoacyl-[acyl-carrier-protein] synthase family protein, partial [Fimbriimonadaceae bacterium]|nr:beta-ketoacyl-[acyl-carrier-protein] synthase family protein [Fimbriimonadaceae bacterium]